MMSFIDFAPLISQVDAFVEPACKINENKQVFETLIQDNWLPFNVQSV